jgi:ubiquinone/menaquinone biosynthesis C-methylase UbiE
VTAPPANFDRLAGVYRLIEFAAFGRDLERARFCLLERLADSRDILVLGEGDGRCVARLAEIAPEARIHCIDASQAMIARAMGRLKRRPGNFDANGSWAKRVTFERADIFSAALTWNGYDAVVTLFFLDCFSTENVRVLIDRIQPSLRRGACWLFADFTVPHRGWSRLQARAWLAVLYAFFRWQTGLHAKELPDSELLLAGAGWRASEERTARRGLLRSVLLKRGS